MQDESTRDLERTILTSVEKRVLGALIEKEMTTPDYYPLTLNALTNACNQKSNRNPAMRLEETAVRSAIDTLREKKLAMMFHGADSRVPRYKHTLDTAYTLEKTEKAILCELFLRGPQTPGELRTRCERMSPFPNLETAETALQNLMEYPGEPLVSKLSRRPGQKEQRYADLLSDSPVEDPEAPFHSAEFQPEPTHRPPTPASPPAEIEELRQEVAELKESLEQLRQEFTLFREQF